MIEVIEGKPMSVLPVEYLCDHCHYGPDPCKRGEVQISSVMTVPDNDALRGVESAIVECDGFESSDGIEMVAVKAEKRN